MKTFFIVCYLSFALFANANNCDTLHFQQAKPPLKISKLDDRAVSIKITGDTAKKPQPLYVVDGILKQAQEIVGMDPQNIERIDVLKSTANVVFCQPPRHVILITTKSDGQKKLRIVNGTGVGIPGATVSIVDENKPADTINLIANDTGEIISNKLLSKHSYRVTVASVGYQTKKLELSFDKNNEKIVCLNQQHIEYQPVTVVGYRVTRYLDFFACGGSYLRISQSCGTNDLDATQKTFKIYPNPTTKGSFITIELLKDFPGNAKILLYDFSGHLILQQEINSKADIQKMQLPVIAAGVYQVILFNSQSGNSVVGKLVVL